MRLNTLLLALSCAVLAAWTPVDAAACPKICNQKTVWGTGPASTKNAPCECTTIINGLGSGPNECVCGICYLQASSKVTTFGVSSDGSCPFGSTNCGDCDLPDSGSSGNSSSTKTTAPPSTDPTASNTPSPSLTSSAPSPSDTSSAAAGNTTMTPVTPSPSPTRGSPNNTATDVASNGTVNHADGKSGTTPVNTTTTAPPSSTSAKSNSNDGLATWQIALIICSGVLVMAVAMMTITSCYCKARNRMKDNMQDEEERVEYEGYWNPNGSGGMTNSGHEQVGQSTFNSGMPMNGRGSFNSTHSRPNSTKNMPYSEPTYAVDERIGAGVGRPPARQSLGSNGDLPGVFQPFPQRDVRPSHEVGSRKNIAIEL